jgi:hypothetical protein
MLSGWRWLNGSHRIDQTCFQSRMLFQVEPFGLLAIRLILVDRAEIGFLSHCLPSPFSVTEANGSQVEFVPWRSEKDKALSLTSPRPDAGNAFRVTLAPFLHDRHFSVASTGRPDPEPIPDEEIVSNRASPAAALVPAQSDLMACSKMRQSDAIGDSQEFQYLRLWASTRMRRARIAHSDRLDMHMPSRTEK